MMSNQMSTCWSLYRFLGWVLVKLCSRISKSHKQEENRDLKIGPCSFRLREKTIVQLMYGDYGIGRVRWCHDRKKPHEFVPFLEFWAVGLVPHHLPLFLAAALLTVLMKPFCSPGTLSPAGKLCSVQILNRRSPLAVNSTVGIKGGSATVNF